jgi:hypothetical protein
MRTTEALPSAKAEQAALAKVCSRRSQMLLAHDRAALERLVQPIHDVLRMAGLPGSSGARTVLLREMHHRQMAFWGWDEPMWSSILGSSGRALRETVTSEPGARLRLLVLPTPAGPTPRQLGGVTGFVPLTTLLP